MLRVKDLEQFSKSLKPSEFRKQLGPFVLIQKPPEGAKPKKKPVLPPPDLDEPTNPWGEEATSFARPDKMEQGTLSLLFQFDTLVVATLPPLQGVDELSVGRLPDCDLVIEDGSVSKRHAVIRWDDQSRRASVTDLGSTNGTFVNAGQKQVGERTLKDGDIVSFGEVAFWFLLTESLHAKLIAANKPSGFRGI